MILSEAQVKQIEEYLPLPRGNGGRAGLSHVQFLNAVLYVAAHGCQWQGLPKTFGNWHTIYTRMNRWSKNGVLDRIFEYLQSEQILKVAMHAISLDSTSIKGVNPVLWPEI